jgi:hypothetical protein
MKKNGITGPENHTDLVLDDDKSTVLISLGDPVRLDEMPHLNPDYGLKN